MKALYDMLRVQARLHRKQGANALGDLFENVNKEMERLEQQLKEANERVEELEGFYATYEREFKAVADWAISMSNDICEGKYEKNTPEGMIYSESQWVDCRWKDVTDPLFTSHSEALTKRDIEHQLKGVQLVIDALASKGMLDTLIGFVINSVAQQLRKEQE